MRFIKIVGLALLSSLAISMVGVGVGVGDAGGFPV